MANHRRRSLAASLLVLSGLTAALVGPAATLAATPATATTTVCSETHWPVSVQGKPTMLKTGGAAGDYLWHDSNGWHLRVTHPGHAKVTFTGRKKTLTYKFYNYGYIDGIDFKTACAQRLGISAAVNGHKLSTSRIWLGRHGRHPLENRFVVVKIV